MKYKKFNDWKIFPKIIFLAAGTVILLLAVFYMFMIPLIEEHLFDNKRKDVQHAVEIAYGVIDYYAKMSESGEMTPDAAKAAAKKEVERLRYNENEYFFINDFNCIVIMHPIKPELNGKDLSDYKDPNGMLIFKKFAEIGKREGSGFVKYMWPKPGFTQPQPKISFVKAVQRWDWVIGSGIYMDDIEEDMALLTNRFLIILIAVSVISLLIGFIIARNITRSFKELNEAADKLAGGNTQIKVTYIGDNEVGKLGATFNSMVDQIRRSMEEIMVKSKEAEQAAKEAESAKTAAQTQEEYLAKNTVIILNEMEKFADGDLSVRLNAEKDGDDIAHLFNGFNRVVNKISEMIHQLTDAIEATASASAQITSSTEEMAAGSQEQSSQTNEVAGAVEEMTKTIFENSKNTSHAAESAKSSGDKAIEGGKVVSETIEGMNKIAAVVQKSADTIFALGQNSEKIGEIIQVIDDIADQTNLLALNAAIEAARAGEQGRGFAVVADEVRKLAERTTKATKEIAQMIKQIQKDTGEAVDSIKQGTREVEIGKLSAVKAGEVLGVIVTNARNVSDVVTQVAAASEEQSATVEEIGKSIESINQVTQESASAIQQIARAAEDLNRLTVNLQEIVAYFKVDSGSSAAFSQALLKPRQNIKRLN